jgi:hypothetical protein
MSSLCSVELGEGSVFIRLKLTKEEYDSMPSDAKEFLVVPINKMDSILVTGKLGNGNKIIVPSRFLRSNGVASLQKTVKAKISKIEEKKFLIIELEDKKPGVPVFGEE